MDEGSKKDPGVTRTAIRSEEKCEVYYERMFSLGKNF